MYVCMYACMHVCMLCNVFMYVMYVCMHACMYVCLYVCMYALWILNEVPNPVRQRFGKAGCKCFTAMHIPLHVGYNLHPCACHTGNSFYVILKRFLSRQNKQF